MRRIVVIAALCIVAIAPAADARGKQVAYVGGHPIPGGGWCEIEGPHVHLYAPEHATELYRVTGGRYYFIGDPVPFGYHGDKHAYAGRHPIAVGHDEVWCYLDGPHYHAFAPPPHDKFVERGGVEWYVGEWPRRYHVDEPRYVTINAIYKPLVYARPVVIVAPPPGYHAPVVTEVVVYHFHHKHKHKHHHHHHDDDDWDDDD